MPKLLNIGFPVLGTLVSLVMALFWPDLAGPPPITLDQAVANIQMETVIKALSKSWAFMSATDELDRGINPCAQFNASGRCILPNDDFYNRLWWDIPDTLEKIFPADDPTIKDYAAARRIPYLVAFGQLALPLMFQWVWMADGLTSTPANKPPIINCRLNSQLRSVVVALSDNIDAAIAQSIERRTEDDLKFYYWDGTDAGLKLPDECGLVIKEKTLRWCVIDQYPGGPDKANWLIMKSITALTCTIAS
uniref:Uncharacterized protein n=1 Tax=Tetradesmus obliquus TaxID=3088 RepID=A0A383VNX6_TETOB|eukprot:jgi/Sobl393_1/13672/SZX67227.1